MNALQLRRVKPGDWPRVKPMMAAFYRHFGYAFSDRRQGRAFRTLLEEERRGVAWLIQLEAEPIGYIVLTHGWSIEYGGLISVVDEFYIAPKFRGRGAGRRVLRLIRRAARKLRVRLLLLEVEAHNRRAKSLYARVGFQDTRRTMMRMDLHGAI